MKELKERANSYSDENVIYILKEAFAKVYLDGYRDGYKDCEKEIPVDLRGNSTEFVDLGLPSGTLWAKNVEWVDDAIKYVPYAKANLLNLPTIEQFEELKAYCSWFPRYTNTHQLSSVSFVGRNGNFIIIPACSYMRDDIVEENVHDVHFWIKENNDEKHCNSIRIRVNIYFETIKERTFPGYKLPLLLIRNK